MPLRDHFRPPLSSRHSWEGLSAQWAAVVVQQLHSSLPEEYAAEPAVPTGAVSELDAVPHVVDASPVWTAPAPTFTVDTDLPCENACAVRVYDMRYGRQLVAAIEIVSPANKDRPEHRRAFAVKAAALVQQGVAVSIVDVVTIRQFNLYADVLDLQGHADASLGPTPPHLYVATMRVRKPPRGKPMLDLWFTPLELGQPLPILPLWLDEDLAVKLDLEPTYEDACRVLRIA